MNYSWIVQLLKKSSCSIADNMGYMQFLEIDLHVIFSQHFFHFFCTTQNHFLVSSVHPIYSPNIATTISSLITSKDPVHTKYRYFSASPLWTRYSPGVENVVRMCWANALRQPWLADSKMVSDKRSRCRCIAMSPRSSSGKSRSVCEENRTEMKKGKKGKDEDRRQKENSQETINWFRRSKKITAAQ